MNNDWLDIAVLEDYLDGKLDSKTMNRVEREALEDPFVAEALAGLSASPKRSLESISLLQKQLHDRIAQQQTSKKAAIITWQRLSIAAAAAVMFITAGIVFWMKQVNYQQMAAKQPKKVEVVIAPLPVEKDTHGQPPMADASISNGDLAAIKKTKLFKSKKIIGTDNAARQTLASIIASDSSTLAKVAIPDSGKNDLNEVVIRGYAKRNREQTTASSMVISGSLLKDTIAITQIHPIDGWDHLYMYIASNSKFKDKPRVGKSVILTFLVDTAGKPNQIKVLEGISKAYDKEAIRLLSEGPKWEQPKVEGTRNTFKFDF